MRKSYFCIFKLWNFQEEKFKGILSPCRFMWKSFCSINRLGTEWLILTTILSNFTCCADKAFERFSAGYYGDRWDLQAACTASNFTTMALRVMKLLGLHSHWTGHIAIIWHHSKPNYTEIYVISIHESRYNFLMVLEMAVLHFVDFVPERCTRAEMYG